MSAHNVQPYIYHYVALFVSLLCMVTFFYARLFQSWAIVLIGPFVLGLSGISNIFYLTTLSYVIFTGVVMLLMVLLLPEPKSVIGLSSRMILILLLAWVGPYSVLALPVSVLVLLFFSTTPRHKLLLTWSILSVISYFFFVDGGMADPLAIIREPGYLTTFLTVLVDQILFIDLFGHVEGIYIVLSLILLSAFFYLFKNDTAFVRFSAILFIIVLLNLYLLFGSSKFGKFLYIMENYLFISHFFWLVFILLALDKLLMRYRQSALASIAVGSVLLAFVFIDNSTHPYRMRYPIRPGMGEYLKEIDFLEKNEAFLIENKMYVDSYADWVYPNVDRPYVYFGYDGPGKKKVDISKLRAIV